MNTKRNDILHSTILIFNIIIYNGGVESAINNTACDKKISVVVKLMS